MGFEPTASTMRMLRAPNCANAPGQPHRATRPDQKISLLAAKLEKGLEPSTPSLRVKCSTD